MYFTIANHNNEQKESGFETLDIDFKDIPKYVLSNGYCSNSLVDGSRARNKDSKQPIGIERYNGKENVLILDIDDGVTIKTIQECFRKYNCIIITTRHHHKIKAGKMQGDRFRVFLEIEPINDYNLRIKLITGIYKTFIFIDQACKNANRFFYSSPNDAEVFVNITGRKFNIQKYQTIFDSESEVGQIQQNDPEPIPLPNQEFKTVKWAGMTFKVLVKNTEEEEYYDGEIDEEAKLRGIQTFLEDEYYQGQKSNTLFRASAMMINDGFSDEFIEDYLISYWHSKSSSTDRMRDAQQNIRGAFKLR